MPNTMWFTLPILLCQSINYGPTDRLDETSLRLSTRMLGQITNKHDFYDKAESTYYHVYTVPTCFW